MRVLLSTIGSRGDVQPLLALALELRAQGHEARLCAPPDFRDLSESHEVPFVPVGPPVRHAGAARPATGKPSPESFRQLMTTTIAGQFEALGEAAAECDVVVASTALQYAARSIAEKKGIPYYFAAYSPIVLPSPHHAPPPLPGQPTDGAADNHTLWMQQAQRWNELFADVLNEQRIAVGLNPVADVRSYMFTERPLLAADPTLAPWPVPADLQVTQTGAWMLTDPRPLSAELEAFLAAGEPPIYFGFGSTHTSQETSRTLIEVARALGHRAILLSGWAELALVDDDRDCFPISEVNLQALFPRVVAAVHHGGAGTTTTAARAGTPQVVVPHMYDQHYFARRVDYLGIGVAHVSPTLTADSLAAALKGAFQPEVAIRAKSVANVVRTDGAATAAEYITR